MNEPTTAGLGRLRSVIGSTGRRRRRIQAIADGSAMFVSIVIAAVLRYEFEVPGNLMRDTILFALVGAAVYLVAGMVSGLYSGKWSFGSFEELSTVVETVSIATVVLLGVTLVLDRLVPLSVPLIASSFVLTASAGVRYIWRWDLERRLRPSHSDVERVVVIGAGEGGHQIVTAMLRNPSGRYLPVALLDDDPLKRNLRVRGVPVRGGHAQLGEVAAAEGPPSPCSPSRAPAPPSSARSRSWPTPRTSSCSCCRRRASSTAPGWRWPTSGPSPRPTSSAATSTTPTWRPSPATSPASACSSPAPAGRSGPSSAASSTATPRPAW
ncbi:MAG: hypothetical protein R2746_05120 [Acidimicrobiales bacterium]